MTTNQEITKVIDLDSLASGRLPEKVVQSLCQMEMSVEEWLEYEGSKPSFQLVVSSVKGITMEFRFRISFDKLKSLISGWR